MDKLGCEKGNAVSTMIVKNESFVRPLLARFNDICDDIGAFQTIACQVIAGITGDYNKNLRDFIYLAGLYNIFNEFLENISEDVFPNESIEFKESKIWSMLCNFEKYAAFAGINKLQKYNGGILSVSVGLDKIFTDLAVIHEPHNFHNSIWPY